MFICIALACLKYLWDLQKRMKTDSVPHPKWLRRHRLAQRPQGLIMYRGTVLVWPLLASSPRLGDWQWIFECFYRLSPNYTYLKSRNFVCQHSVMVETTVKQRVFAPLSCKISKIVIRSIVYVGAIFSAVNTTCGDSTRLLTPGGEVGTVAFKTVSPASLILCSGV